MNTPSQSEFINLRCGTFFSSISSLALGLSYGSYGRNFATLTISPMFEHMRGKTPTKGEKVYDHDNAIFMSLDAVNLAKFSALVTAMTAEDSDIGDIEVVTGTDANNTSLRLIRASSVEGGDTEFSKNFILYIQKSTGDSQRACEFPMNAESLTAFLDMTIDKTGSRLVQVNPNLEVLKSWIETAKSMMLLPVDYIMSLRSSAGRSVASSNAVPAPQGQFRSRRGASAAPAAGADWAQRTSDESEDNLPF